MTGFTAARYFAGLIIFLAGCAESVSGPGVSGGKTCQAVPVPAEGTVSLIPATTKAELCLNIPAGKDRYFIAFADQRALDRARIGPVGNVDPYSDILVHGVKRVTILRTELSAGSSPAFFGASPKALMTPDEPFCTQNPTFLYCRNTPLVVGERFGQPTGLRYVVMAIEGPFVVAVEEKMYNTATVQLREEHLEVIRRIAATHVPLLESIFGPLPKTSAGIGKIVLLLGGNYPTQSNIIGDGATTDGFIIAAFATDEQSFDPTFMFYIIAHELTHLEQYKWAWELDPAGRKKNALSLGYWGMPLWAAEGGADFLACESLRNEAGVAFGSNLALSFQPKTYLAQYSTCLKNGGGGDLEAGYSSGAGYLRNVTENLVTKGVPLETARREVALGALEGWFGIDEAGLHFTGLTQRVSALLGTQFDPGLSIVTEAMQFAFDDVVPNSQWNVTSTLNAWKYFGYNQSMSASADTAAVKVPAAGDGLGYMLIVGDSVARDVRVSIPVSGMRWLIGRQKQ